jgi:hypothetical protein
MEGIYSKIEFLPTLGDDGTIAGIASAGPGQSGILERKYIEGNKLLPERSCPSRAKPLHILDGQM